MGFKEEGRGPAISVWRTEISQDRVNWWLLLLCGRFDSFDYAEDKSAQGKVFVAIRGGSRLNNAESRGFALF